MYKIDSILCIIRKYVNESDLNIKINLYKNYRNDICGKYF